MHADDRRHGRHRPLTIALADLDNHRMDRAKHLVLIMTDGQWQGGWATKRHLACYKDDGRQMIGFGYGADYLARTMIGYGCDEAFAIQRPDGHPAFPGAGPARHRLIRTQVGECDDTLPHEPL